MASGSWRYPSIQGRSRSTNIGIAAITGMRGTAGYASRSPCCSMMKPTTGGIWRISSIRKSAQPYGNDLGKPVDPRSDPGPLLGAQPLAPGPEPPRRGAVRGGVLREIFGAEPSPVVGLEELGEERFERDISCSRLMPARRVGKLDVANELEPALELRQ